MSVSGVGASSSIYGQLASGSKLMSAADNAAGVAITEKEEAQINGYDAGTNNIKSQQDALNIADGATQSIVDSLQRMRELAVQASNSALMSDSDLASIQEEINGLKEGINGVAEQTTYNTKNLLNDDLSFEAASDANGSANSINTYNSTLAELGLEDFDVTGDFDISKLDDAISKLSTNLASYGAQSNSIDYAALYNSNTSYNTSAANSRIEDLDYPQAVSEKEKQRLLDAYALEMQKKKQEDEERGMQNILNAGIVQ